MTGQVPPGIRPAPERDRCVAWRGGWGRLPWLGDSGGIPGDPGAPHPVPAARFPETGAVDVNIVDLVVIGLVILSAIHGLRLGAIVQVLSYGGFIVGLFLGALLASVTVRWAHDATARTLMSLGTMLGVAVLLATAGRVVGTVAFRRVHRGVFGPVDSALGVVVAVVATLLAAWLVANTLVNSSSLALNSAISESRILRSVDSAPARTAVGLLPGAELPLGRGLPPGLRPAGSGVRRPGLLAGQRPAAGGGQSGRPVDGQDRRRGLRPDPRGLRASWSPPARW